MTSSWSWQYTTHSSSFRARYVVPYIIMSSMPEQHYTFVVVVLYAIPCSMGPWYIGSPQNNKVLSWNNHTSLLVISWINIGPTSGRQYRRWANVGSAHIAVWVRWCTRRWHLIWGQWIYVYFKITNGRLCAVSWAVLSSVHDASKFDNLE